MTKLTIIARDGTERRIDATPGMSLMLNIRESGAEEILALCGGCCSCATCHVYVAEEDWSRLPPIGEDENDLLGNSAHRRDTSRLSCQIMIADDLEGMRIIVAAED